MGFCKLEVRCPQKVYDITADPDPDPDWSFDALVAELNSLEKRLYGSSHAPTPFIKIGPCREVSDRRTAAGSPAAFVMRVSDDDEVEDSDGEGEEEEEEDDRPSQGDKSLAIAKRFTCDDLYLSESDDSDDERALDSQPHLMDEVGLVESALVELGREHRLGVQEEIRNQISGLEEELTRLHEMSLSAFTRVKKYEEARRELDRKVDTQYQRKVAEALDNHLTAIQRDYERKSQLEERRIRSDAAHEEAKRKEKAHHEERLRQEWARAEAEANHKAEEEKKALEEEKRKVLDASKNDTAKAIDTTSAVPQQETSKNEANNISGSEHLGTKKSQSTGDVVRAAKSALNLEEGRLQKLKVLDETNLSLRSRSNMDFSSYERHISRLIRQIGGIADNVRTKASELLKILSNPSCPQSISLAAFVQKVVSIPEHSQNTYFARAQVIVLVTSQVPQAMDLILAELHRACIYTVPKHILNYKSAFESKEANYDSIGYCEQDGKIENTMDDSAQLNSYMKLYGALVQTEIPGVVNLHGLAEGWAWLARFLNVMPANLYTAVALNAFLETAGYGLFRRYQSQFRKMLNVISNHFLKDLRERRDSELRTIIADIQSYIQENEFLQEPERRRMEGKLQSRSVVPNLY